MKKRSTLLIILFTSLFSLPSYSFFGMFSQMMQGMPFVGQFAKMMGGGQEEGGGGQQGGGGGNPCAGGGGSSHGAGPWDVMMSMVNGMTDGMKLGFQGIDCYGDKIGLMSDRIGDMSDRMGQFAGQGPGPQRNGNGTYGKGCDFGRIPLSSGQCLGGPNNGIDYSKVMVAQLQIRDQIRKERDAAINTERKERAEAEKTKVATREQKTSEILQKANIFFLPPLGDGAIVDVDNPPQITLTNGAQAFFLSVSTKPDFPQENSGNLLIVDSTMPFQDNWKNMLTALAETNELGNDYLYLTVTTFLQGPQMIEFKPARSIRIKVVGLAEMSQKMKEESQKKLDETKKQPQKESSLWGWLNKMQGKQGH